MVIKTPPRDFDVVKSAWRCYNEIGSSIAAPSGYGIVARIGGAGDFFVYEFKKAQVFLT
ncbi:MAG: hypothetical protein J6O13_01550 [Selenomonas sp.]|nr:hypothetical protein [Selenomonas sp.]